MATTSEDVWRLLAELTAAQKENAQQLKEQRQEADRRQKETDRQLRELGKQIGGLGAKFGSFTEGLAQIGRAHV